MTERSGDKRLPRESLRPETGGVRMSCSTCGVTFLRREAATPKKGRLACPECGGVELETDDSEEPR